MDTGQAVEWHVEDLAESGWMRIMAIAFLCNDKFNSRHVRQSLPIDRSPHLAMDTPIPATQLLYKSTYPYTRSPLYILNLHHSSDHSNHQHFQTIVPLLSQPIVHIPENRCGREVFPETGSGLRVHLVCIYRDDYAVDERWCVFMM